MKKTLAIAGVLALIVPPATSFADHVKPKQSEIRAGGNLSHTNLFATSLRGEDLSNANLSGATLWRADLNRVNLRGANLTDTNLTGVTQFSTRGCPKYLPKGWVCENNSLIKL